MPIRIRLKHKQLATVLGRSNLSQNHWAMRLGLDKGHLSQLVNGKRPYPNAVTRRKLLKGTDAAFDELFEVEEAATGRGSETSPEGRLQVRVPRMPTPSGERDGPMQSLFNDIKYGLRAFLRYPMFAAIVVATLGIGIGANTTIFSVINEVLLEPLPFRDPDRIVTLYQTDEEGRRDGVSAANFKDIEENALLFEAASIMEPYSFDYSGEGDPEVIISGLVSKGFFEVWGVAAVLGRTFLPEEYEAGGNAVTVLSYGLWQRRFGADPDIVGRRIQLDEGAVTVVGVMGRQFRPRLFEAEKELWVPRPYRSNDEPNRGAAYLMAVGRLAGGVSLGRAGQELAALSATLEERYPQPNAQMGVELVPLAENLVGGIRPALLLLLATVGCVLLIVCANVAGLILSWNHRRGRSFAVRAAIGAGRAQLIRQLLIESGLLAVSGGLAGLLVAWAGLRSIQQLGPPGIPRLENVGLDPQLLLFTLLVALGTALVFGLVPALQFSRPDLQETLKDGSRSAGTGAASSRVRRLLIIGEVALAVLLLVGAGLLMRSFASLLNTDPGYRVERVAALQAFIWDRHRSNEARAVFFDETLGRIQTLPGVESAGAVSALPLIDSSIDIDTSFTVEDRPAPVPGQEPNAFLSFATRGYFETMGIPLRTGRLFDQRDVADSAATVVINETLARKMWSDGDALGRRITMPFFGRPVYREIVGVVGDVRHAGFDADPRPEIFVPHAQYAFGSMTYVIRTRGAADDAIPELQAAVWEVDPLQTFYESTTLEALLADSVASRRFTLGLLGIFSIVSLFLSGVGLYGVISFQTSQRFQEIGVRIALGAGSSQILKMVLRQGLSLAAAGLVVGLGGALVLSRFIEALLYGIRPADPLTFFAIAVLLMVVALAASYAPARRATKTNPVAALRAE